MSSQIQSNNEHWDFMEFFLLQPTITFILCMILYINALIAVDYAHFRAQTHNNNAKNDATRLNALRNHDLFIEFKAQTNKAIKELEETCVKVMHLQNAITNGLKEVETTINANVAILSEAQTIVATGLKEADRNIRDVVCMQVELANTQNEIATTQNEFADVQKSLVAANSETRRLQIDMFGIQNTFSNGLKEVERNVRELIHAQIDFTTAQNRLETEVKNIRHTVTAQRERLDAKDIADKALSNEVCDLHEEMNDLHDQQNVKITENAVHIAEIAAMCKELVERCKRGEEKTKQNKQLAIDIYRYWKTIGRPHGCRLHPTLFAKAIDAIYKQYYNFTFIYDRDNVQSIADATFIVNQSELQVQSAGY